MGELTDLLEIGFRTYKDSPCRELVAAAGVLVALRGALINGRAESLLSHLAPFADAEIMRLQPRG